MDARRAAVTCIMLATALLGCRSPYYADRYAGIGAGVGALGGAVIANNTGGDSATGALVGGALGALTGHAVGDTVDAEIQRNNAIIKDRMGRVLTGAVTPGDVMAMTENGVAEDVIVSHIRANGVARQPSTQDIINMTRNNVSDRVIKSMSTPLPTPKAVVHRRGAPVIVEEHYYGPGYYHPALRPPPRFYRRFHRRPGVRWGVAFSN